MDTAYAPRIEAGAAFLEENDPGWMDRINLDELDIGCSANCIFGQLYGEFQEGKRQYGLSNEKTAELGFALLGFTTVSLAVAAYDLLTYAWIDYITARREELALAS